MRTTSRSNASASHSHTPPRGAPACPHCLPPAACLVSLPFTAFIDANSAAQVAARRAQFEMRTRAQAHAHRRRIVVGPVAPAVVVGARRLCCSFFSFLPSSGSLSLLRRLHEQHAHMAAPIIKSGKSITGACQIVIFSCSARARAAHRVLQGWRRGRSRRRRCGRR